MVTFELFARPMLESMAGLSPQKLRFVHVRLKSPIRVKPGLKRFLPGMLSGEFEGCKRSWFLGKDRAMLRRQRADCLVVIPADPELIQAGEFVPILLR